MKTRVSVVVPVLNGARTILATLASLDAQTLDPATYEVVVVDDGSTDGTPDAIRAYAAGARAQIDVIERPHFGPAAARNAGIEATASEFVAFTDADVEVSPQWLARALARLDAEPALAGVEGRTLPKGTPGPLTHQMRNETGGLYMTCNMVYRRTVIEATGGFDERFRTAFLEDSDLAFRILEKGDAIKFDPEVLAHHAVLHEGRRKFWKEARKRFYVPLIRVKHRRLYRQLLKPVVPMYPSLYVEEVLSVSATIIAAVNGAWAAAVPSAMLSGIAFRRVAHAWRAHDPISILQALCMPFVQAFWVGLGWLRFAVLERIGAPEHEPSAIRRAHAARGS
jgi:glycosyltransferase involved in cell wall biosynthesis